jgi:acid stress-induced BolA-like protein IbaG/YrbA
MRLSGHFSGGCAELAGETDILKFALYMSIAVKEALEFAIHAVVPTAKIDLRVVNGHWCGMVVACEFDAMTHSERHRQVWERITHDLGSNAVEVGALQLYSPVEAEAMESED